MGLKALLNEYVKIIAHTTLVSRTMYHLKSIKLSALSSSKACD